jgi:hypothetical protein
MAKCVKKYMKFDGLIFQKVLREKRAIAESVNARNPQPCQSSKHKIIQPATKAIVVILEYYFKCYCQWFGEFFENMKHFAGHCFLWE